MTRIRHSRANPIPADLIAACGMNCSLCMAYGRDKNACLGCRSGDCNKFKSCRKCSIKNCTKTSSGKIHYCFDCDDFPCDRLVHLDKRYRTQYSMSMIENLNAIKGRGIRHFIENEKKRWECPGCGHLLCVHKSECIYCHRRWRNNTQEEKRESAPHGKRP